MYIELLSDYGNLTNMRTNNCSTICIIWVYKNMFVCVVWSIKLSSFHSFFKGICYITSVPPKQINISLITHDTFATKPTTLKNFSKGIVI